MTTILNNKTILKPGHLVKTTQNQMWGSTKYWGITASGWQDIPTGSAALIISVDNQKIVFLHQDCLFHIQNCYNDREGNPHWCQIIK